MPFYTLICQDKPDSLELRMATRPSHVAYLGEHKDKLRLGGPFLDGEGKMNGSLLIVEVDDLDAVKAFSANDPYTKAGLFASVEIKALMPAAGTWAAK